MDRLRHRADFLKAAKGTKASTSGFVLQVHPRDKGGPARVGFTVSRKVGNAVERNRVRRRLREVVRLSGRGWMLPNHDYVMVGRRAALRIPFERLADDFTGALRRVHSSRTDNRRAALASAGGDETGDTGIQ